jgi:hypothetical protein
MAKRSAVNKSQAIRDAMAAHPDKSPTEIAAVLKAEHGLKIKPQYVSTIKGNMLRNKGRRGGRRPGRKAVVHAGNGMSAVGPALEFIKAAGGLEAAKAALGTIEEIAGVVG